MDNEIFKLKKVQCQNLISYPNIEIPKDGATFICGKSGSGKSTLLKLLNGVISASSGVIYYSGKIIEEYEPTALRREVLLVGQSSYLFDQTIEENFNKYYTYLNMPFISSEAMKKCLDICTVHMPLDSSCTTLSGGEKQRVFAAINLSYPSKVLMLDEPTSALDIRNASTLIKNIKADCADKGKTLIIVSHDREIANKYADNMITIV